MLYFVLNYIMKKFFLRIAIWYVKDHITNCKIRWDFIESPRYRSDLQQTINILKIISNDKWI